MLGLEIVKKRVKEAPQSSGVYLFKNKKIFLFILEKPSILKEDSLTTGIYPNYQEDFKRWYPKL